MWTKKLSFARKICKFCNLRCRINLKLLFVTLKVSLKHTFVCTGNGASHAAPQLLSRDLNTQIFNYYGSFIKFYPFCLIFYLLFVVFFHLSQQQRKKCITFVDIISLLSAEFLCVYLFLMLLYSAFRFSFSFSLARKAWRKKRHQT